MLLKLDPILLEHCDDYVSLCQTYEGGLGAIPYAESHGGYAFCGYAALVAMNKASCLNQQKLLKWLVDRQMEGEGGFNGRTNKVVDSCYSFWQGAIFQLLSLGSKGGARYEGQLLLDNDALHEYIIMCQDEDGGLFDKPGKHADAYHTCYSLSGFSTTQQNGSQNLCPIDPIYNIPVEKLAKARQYFQEKSQLKLQI